jgi:hypothetical protein
VSRAGLTTSDVPVAGGAKGFLRVDLRRGVSVDLYLCARDLSEAGQRVCQEILERYARHRRGRGSVALGAGPTFVFVSRLERADRQRCLDELLLAILDDLGATAMPPKSIVYRAPRCGVCNRALLGARCVVDGRWVCADCVYGIDKRAGCARVSHAAGVAAWECPCGQDPPRPGTTASPVRTLVSSREPECPFCGRAFRDEYVTKDARA